MDADIVLATDPDADRLGVRVKDKNGEYHDLTGNMSGCLLADYEIGQRNALRGLPEDGYLIKRSLQQIWQMRLQITITQG